MSVSNLAAVRSPKDRDSAIKNSNESFTHFMRQTFQEKELAQKAKHHALGIEVKRVLCGAPLAKRSIFGIHYLLCKMTLKRSECFLLCYVEAIRCKQSHDQTKKFVAAQDRSESSIRTKPHTSHSRQESVLHLCALSRLCSKVFLYHIQYLQRSHHEMTKRENLFIYTVRGFHWPRVSLSSAYSLSSMQRNAAL